MVGKPDKKQRAAIDKRKADHHKNRLAAAEQEARITRQVEALVGDALKRPRTPDTLPDLPALIEKLERIYDLALLIRMPTAAIKAIELEGRLLGLLIERSATAVLHTRSDSSPILGDPADNRMKLIEDLRQQLGSARADAVIAAYEGRQPDTIELAPNDDTDDDSDAE